MGSTNPAPSCTNKFWLEDFKNLLCESTLLPMDGNTLEAQMNSLSRLIVLIFIALAAIKFKHSGWFLVLGLLAVVLIYYIERGSDTPNTTTSTGKKRRSHTPADLVEHMTLPGCAPEANQQGVQGTQPFYTALHQLEDPHSPRVDVSLGSPPVADPDRYRQLGECEDPRLESRRFTGGFRIDGGGASFGAHTLTPNAGLQGPANPKTKVPPVMIPRAYNWDYWKPTNYNFPTLINTENNVDLWRSGFAVSTDCPQSYVAEKIGRSTACADGLPATSKINVDILDPLQVQNLQPNVFTATNVNEPINANKGISYAEQFPPKQCATSGEDLVFLRGYQDFSQTQGAFTTTGCGVEGYMSETSNPGFLPTTPIDVSLHQPPSPANVYDPRFTGYGSDNRCYIEQTQGQPRFFYDDVNSVKMPNYISRSNIDIFPFADSYQSQSPAGNPDTPNIRALAGDAFTESTLQHRTELAELKMRKRNAEMHQLRSAPLSRNQPRMLGSCGTGNR